MAKVLLIQPHNDINTEKRIGYMIPFTLIMLGTHIQKKHKVKIFDRNIDWNDETLFNKINEFKPDIIGVTSITSSMLYDVIGMGKKIKPDVASANIFNVMPGTKLFDDLVKQKKIIKPKSLLEWAGWTLDWRTVVHNCSEIPDDKLIELSKKIWNYNYYKKKIKRLIFWIKKGKFIYLFKKLYGRNARKFK